MRGKRGQSFLFEPSAFVNDPAVAVMKPQEIGAYIVLLCNLWSMSEPGVVPDDNAVLSVLSRTNGEWLEVRAAVSRAFDTTSRPGFWVQKRMVQTHLSQSGFLKRQALAGSRGGKSKSKNIKARLATSISSGSVQYSTEGCSTDGVGTEKTEQLSALSSGRVRRGIPRRNLEDESKLPDGEITADQAFDEIFYPEYPRKRDPQDARKAWKSLRIKDDDEETIKRIMAALRRDIREEWRDRPMDKIPYPAHWLRKRGWED